MLVACRPTSITPSPPPVNKPVELIRAVLLVAGEEIVLSPGEETTVVDVTGDLVYEFSGPIDHSSIPQNNVVKTEDNTKLCLTSIAGITLMAPIRFLSPKA